MVESLQSVSIEAVELAILELRCQRVLLDADIARMYGVETRSLIQAVKRNLGRFPDDFMFQLSDEEWAALRPPDREGRGGRRTLPYAFTQEGVAMLSSVLRSARAVYVNVRIMRAFVACERSCWRALISHDAWTRWKPTTIHSSRWCSRPSGS